MPVALLGKINNESGLDFKSVLETRLGICIYNMAKHPFVCRLLSSRALALL